jgi:glycosyltransferase involved in cell wall biosynthesis/O-antigen/teichoic acid export membrane protein
MATTFSVLVVSLGQIGFPEAVVQREKMDHALASNLFWINVAGGVLLTFGFAAAGSLLARFYHDTRVANVAIGTSLTIFLTSTSVLHLALLKRAMCFSAVSANDIVARVISVGVAVFAGMAGHGYWALVAGAIALPLSQSVGAWFLCRWVPGLPRWRVAGTGSTLMFAVATYGRFAVNYGTRNTDNLLIGLNFSAQSLGFYKKAYDLFALSATQFVHSLTLVVVSALSRMDRESVEYRRHLLGALTVMAFAGMGLAANLTLVGKDLIRLLLGPGWEQSGRIFTFFGPGIGAMIVYYTHGWIHLSIGRADRWFRWGIIEFVVTVSLFLVGLPWGPVGIAIAWTASFWILMVPALWYAGKPIGFGVAPLLAAIWRYILASLLAGFVTSLMIRRMPSVIGAVGAKGAAVRIVMGSLLLGLVYLTAVVILHLSLEPIYQMVGLLRDMAPWRKLPGSDPAVIDAWDTCKSGMVHHREPNAAAESSGKPLVSILIPAYNAEEWIAETIHSALAQTWEPKEIIVVDDGSSDRTLEIARRFESEFVTVLSPKHQGASAARNQAFTLSHGDYIQWLDADDLLAPDKIAKQMEAVQERNDKRTLFSSAWGQFWYRPDRAKFVPSALWCDLSQAEFLVRKLALNLFMQTSTWLVSRELTESAGPWSTNLSVDDDGEYFCRVLLASNGIRFVPEAKVYYRYSGTCGLAYIGNSHSKMDSAWRSMQLHIGYLQTLEDSKRVQNACLKYLQTNLVYFYPERSEIVEQIYQKAVQLGGQLKAPRLSWKFSWLRPLLGSTFARRAQLFLPHLKWALVRSWDKMLFRIDGREKTARALDNYTTRVNQGTFGAAHQLTAGNATERLTP